MKNVIAYPVPFNHKTHRYITIGSKNGATLSAYTKVKIAVMDINGDLVFKSEYSTSTDVIWNGRNSNGKVVRPGMYIIKVTIENGANGDYGEKMIRILING